MKIQEATKGVDENLIITGMIVNDQVCGIISSKWEKRGLFLSPWHNIVSDWCVKYYLRRGESPKRHIENLFAQWSKSSKVATVKAVHKFLGHLHNEYDRRKKEINPDFILDLAGSHFRDVQIIRLSERLQEKIEVGDTKGCWGDFNSIQPIELGVGSITNIFDLEEMKQAYDTVESEVVIKYGGALGRFFGNSLARDSLVAFMAPTGRGKTWVLMDLAWKGMLQKTKCIFFEIGDLTRTQLRRRLITRAICQPIREGKLVRRPISINRIKNKTVVKFREEYKSKGISWNDAKNAFAKILEDRIRDDDKYFKISVHPNDSISAEGIRSILRDMQRREKYVPDAVFIDYPDLFCAPPGFKGEGRDAINSNWKCLRRISQEFHCCVVVVTQGNAMSFDAETLSMKNFADDRRKFDHATAFWGINQNKEEKVDGIMRLNPLKIRDEEFHVGRPVYVAGCLAIANPFVRSFMG